MTSQFNNEPSGSSVHMLYIWFFRIETGVYVMVNVSGIMFSLLVHYSAARL